MKIYLVTVRKDSNGEVNRSVFINKEDAIDFSDRYWSQSKCGWDTVDIEEQETNIPEGYQLVPIEPSEAMRKAAWDQHYGNTEGALLLYKAMLKAAGDQDG